MCRVNAVIRTQEVDVGRNGMTRPDTNDGSLEGQLADLRLLFPMVTRGLRRRPLPAPATLKDTLRGKLFSSRHFLALMHLADAGRMSIGELAERLDVAMPTVSVVIHHLAEHGLVRLEGDAADRRRTFACIDPLHRRWVEAALNRFSAPLHRTLLRLQPEERACFVKAMRLLAEEVSTNETATCYPSRNNKESS